MRSLSVLRIPLPSGIEVLCLAGGLFLVLRYAWILDDAFVYYRYVDNLLFLNLGLVYNHGEYVEGYSSPLWALFLIPLRATGLDYWTLTQVISIVCFVVFWALVVRLNRALSVQGPIVNVPLAFLCFSYGTLCYFTSGMETPLVQIAAVLYALFVVKPGSRGLQILIALTPLIRYEHAVPFLVAAGWGWWRTRRFPFWLVGTAALTMGTWILFKIYYYAELLPNTYYLKSDTSVAQGFAYLWQTVSSYQLLPFLLLSGLAAIWIRRSHLQQNLRLRERLIMGILAATIAVHVVKIGGDPRHHRYLAFPFVLTVCATAGLAEALLRATPAPARRLLAAAAAVAVAGVSFSLLPPQLDRHPVTGNENHRPAAKIQDASWHRNLPELAFTSRRRAEDRERIRQYRRISSGFRYRGVKSISMCVAAYHLYEYRIVQNLGLTDAFLARTDAKPDLPAHKYSLRPRARDLARILRDHPDPGLALYRELVESGSAPDWIRDNLSSIETVSRKIYNRHRWSENLRLAFTFPERIRIPDWREDPEADLDSTTAR